MNGTQPTSHTLTEEHFSSFIGKPAEDGCGYLNPPDVCGPLLQYTGMSLGRGVWQGSVLYVIRNGTLAGGNEPRLVVMDDGAQVQVRGAVLFAFQCWTFWRFELELALRVEERKVRYRLEGLQEEWDFYIAGEQQGFNWAYYSCAGFSSDMPQAERKMGFTPLWDELMRRHSQRPYHLVHGGGDQLYNDQVFRLHTVYAWMHLDPAERDVSAYSPEMQAEAEAFYFTHYMVHYSEAVMRAVMGRIPQLMMWDDHDIFDGFGSYPQELQNSAPFTGLYQVARKFYLLFQHQTTDELAEQHGLIRNGTALSRLALLGPRTALLAADLRSERLRTQILPPGAWPQLMGVMDGLPPSVRHLVVGSGVPVVYPSLAEVEQLMGAVSEANRTGSQGLMRYVANIVGKSKFDEPELLDDLLDHWNAEPHLPEKREMVAGFQNLSKTRGIRVSFISGDVHLCATGRMRTPGKLAKEADHKYMLQVVSSAIVNRPPPDGLVTFLSQKAMYNQTLMEGTQERMRATFGGFFAANVKAKLLNKRNFCSVAEGGAGELVFTLVVEQTNVGEHTYKDFDTAAPPLNAQDAEAAS